MGIYQGTVKISSAGGKSPYDIAKENGFSGTEQEFNNALIQITKINEIDSITPHIVNLTLPASLWEGATAPYSQVVVINGILADDTKQSISIASIPTPENVEAISKAGVYVKSQGENVITFEANEKPETDIQYIVQFQKAIAV